MISFSYLNLVKWLGVRNYADKVTQKLIKVEV